MSYITKSNISYLTGYVNSSADGIFCRTKFTDVFLSGGTLDNALYDAGKVTLKE